VALRQEEQSTTEAQLSGVIRSVYVCARKEVNNMNGTYKCVIGILCVLVALLLVVVFYPSVRTELRMRENDRKLLSRPTVFGERYSYDPKTGWSSR
jgi:hypothetical protein